MLSIFRKYVTQAESLPILLLRRNIKERIFLPERLPGRRFGRIFCLSLGVLRTGLQPEEIIPFVLKRSVAPPFDMNGFQPFL